MEEQNKQETRPSPDEKIARAALVWRNKFDKPAIADKSNDQLRRNEYRARQELRKVIDQAGQHE